MATGYDLLNVVTYEFAAVNFGSGTTTSKLPIPRSARFARVMDIMVICSTTFTQVTTGALVQIGDGTTANAFAQLAIGGLTATNTISGRDMTSVTGVWIANYVGGSNPAVGVNGILHDLVATFVAPTGGTPAGVGTVFIVVGYDTINRNA